MHGVELKLVCGVGDCIKTLEKENYLAFVCISAKSHEEVREKEAVIRKKIRIDIS